MELIILSVSLFRIKYDGMENRIVTFAMVWWMQGSSMNFPEVWFIRGRFFFWTMHDVSRMCSMARTWFSHHRNVSRGEIPDRILGHGFGSESGSRYSFYVIGCYHGPMTIPKRVLCSRLNRLRLGDASSGLLFIVFTLRARRIFQTYCSHATR